MPLAMFCSPMPVSAEEVYAWHTRPGAFERLTPPWELATLLHASLPFTEGSRWRFKSRIWGPVKRTWLVEHFGIEPGRLFCYRMLTGSFSKWEHTLRFIPNGIGSFHENNVDYSLPCGVLNRLFSKGIAKRINDMFLYRQRLAAEDLARHAQFRNSPRLRIAVSGSRGLIGSQLVHFLTSGGHHVLRLVSDANAKSVYDDGTTWIAWKPLEPLPQGVLNGIDAVIHLAGDNIASGRWTETKKKRIFESRVISTKHLATAIDREGVPTFLCGSAVGIYGDRGDEILDEEAAWGQDFLARVCRVWEAASRCQARVVNLRTSLVLWPPGGLLKVMLPSFRLGGGAMLGNGRQYMPWISMHDMVYAIHHCLMTPITGSVNMCSPNPETNREFSRTLANVLRTPFLLTAPRFALKAMFGEAADGALLASQRTTPVKLLASGFVFSNDTLGTTLRFLLNRSS